jgi:hypothetical protein
VLLSTLLLGTEIIAMPKINKHLLDRRWSIFLLTFFLASVVDAKSYVGFDLCGLAKKETIEVIQKETGATLASIETNENVESLVTYNIEKYPLLDFHYKIKVSTFHDLVSEIEIEQDDSKMLSDFLGAKYGEPSKPIQMKDLLKTSEIYIYKVKSDPNLILTEVYSAPTDIARSTLPGVIGHTSKVRYICKPLMEKITLQVKKKLANEKKERTQKVGEKNNL